MEKEQLQEIARIYCSLRIKPFQVISPPLGLISNFLETIYSSIFILSIIYTNPKGMCCDKSTAGQNLRSLYRRVRCGGGAGLIKLLMLTRTALIRRSLSASIKSLVFGAGLLQVSSSSKLCWI